MSSLHKAPLLRPCSSLALQRAINLTHKLAGVSRVVFPQPVGTTAISSPAIAQRTESNVLPFQPAVYTRQMSSLDGVHDVAYEVVQGPLVRYCEAPSTGRHPQTAVLVHGILGQRRNMMTFAKRLVQEFPSWQVVLVDLRCHGESALSQAAPAGGPHGVESAAADVLKLLGRLKLFPEVLIGHSFGGKVVLSMAEQFGRVGRTLPKPVQVWVLDALPGHIRQNAAATHEHPANIIRLLQQLPSPFPDRATFVQALRKQGISSDIANWLATNLRHSAHGGLEWAIDLAGIAEMYNSYEKTQLWQLITAPQQGLKIDFVKAERSSFRWHEDEHVIKSHGHGVHLLRDSSHWVHQDNLEGLLEIIKPSMMYA